MDMKFVWLLVANILFIVLVRFTRHRKKFNGLLTVLLTTLVTLTLIESAYRLFFKKKGFTETGNFGASFNTPVDITGFTVKNISDLQVIKKDPAGNVMYDAHYSIIPDSGFNVLPINHRIGYHVSNISRDSVEIIFLGCSFTFATGIADTATMAYRVGKALNYNSLNYGGSGFGTHQSYQLFKNKYSQVPDHKKRIFVYTFIPDHLLRAKCIYTWCLNDPYFEVKNDSLSLLGPAYKHTSSARSQVLVRLFSLNRALSLVSDLGNNIVQAKGAESVNEDDYKRIGLMLGEINKQIQEQGNELIILHWDDYKGSQNPKGGYYVDINKMKNLFNGLPGAKIVNVSSFFDFNDSNNLIPKDNHPSVIGNGLMANKILELINNTSSKN